MSKALFIDWSTSKPLTVFNGRTVRKIDKSKFHPPLSSILYIEGIPPYERDDLSKKGYTLYTCSLQETQKLRKELNISKSDKTDVKLLSQIPKSRWHKWIQTEPEIIEIKILLSKRQNILNHVQLSKTQLKLKGYHYRDSSELEDWDHKLREVDRSIKRMCKSINFHSFHSKIYGVGGQGCQTALIALSKRPWTFTRGINGWLRYNGLTHEAWDGYGRKHSLGSDVELKSCIYGSSLILLSKKSPYRKNYLRLKSKLPVLEKETRAWRGHVKISSHKRALNRIVTNIAIELYRVSVDWKFNKGIMVDSEARGSGEETLPKKSLRFSHLMTVSNQHNRGNVL